MKNDYSNISTHNIPFELEDLWLIGGGEATL